MGTSVFGIVATESQAADIITRLKSHGFPRDDISVLLPDRAGTRQFAHEQHTKAPEGAATGAGTGGLLGGAMGWLVGIGALAIPGLGPFIAAGPIMGALGGAAVGAAVGGFAGALIGMGIPEYEAKRYEGRLKDGGILLSVHAEDRDQVRLAKEVFEECQAMDIASASEKGVPASDDRDAPTIEALMGDKPYVTAHGERTRPPLM